MKKFLLRLILSKDERRFIKTILLKEAFHHHNRINTDSLRDKKKHKDIRKANIFLGYHYLTKLF